MLSQSDSEGRNLHDWFIRYLDYFRNEFAQLPEDVRKAKLPPAEDYGSPCQFEVFWLKNPEMQLVFKSTFKDRPDKEIIIHGPYEGYEFLEKVEPVLNEPRWKNKLIGEAYIYQERTMDYFLAYTLRRMVEEAKMSLFHKIPFKGRAWGQFVSSEMWMELYHKNAATLDHVESVNSVIRDISRRAEQLKKEKELNPSKTLQAAEQPSKSAKGYAVYLYPPILVGERPRRTPSDELYGRDQTFSGMPVFGFDFKTEFGDYKVGLARDGFLLLPISDKETALKAMNTIMSAGMLQGLDFLAVREHELSEVAYDKETMQPGGMTYNSDATLRTRLFNERFAPNPQNPRRSISEGQITEIISTAGKIFKEGKHVEDMRLLSEAFTHLHDAEYAQSFIMSWTILERYLSELWKKKIQEKNVDGNRTSKLMDTNRWSADHLVEVLNLDGIIKEEDYDKFMDMKRKRNRFIHQGKQLFRDDATQCFNMAKEIVVKRIELPS